MGFLFDVKLIIVSRVVVPFAKAMMMMMMMVRESRDDALF